jgi:N-hydroxyarylamine O-acetyltransferase
MAALPDLAAYLAHLGYQGDALPTRATLGQLHRLHPQAIAFENLSPLLGQAVPLELGALQRKLVGGGRGGWCFEHNLLLRAMLLQLGYAVTGLAARVLWQQSPEALTPRSHMLLLVELGERRYLVDVGFGGLTLTAPLELVADREQETPHGRFVLRATSDGYSLWSLLPQGWCVLYRFDLQPQLPADYEFANWYLATHPASLFVNTLWAARVAADGRHALLDARYSFHAADGQTHTRQLDTVQELREVLREQFKVVAPAGADVDARLLHLLQN